VIYRALGDTDCAREALQWALALNPHFQVLHAENGARPRRVAGRATPLPDGAVAHDRLPLGPP